MLLCSIGVLLAMALNLLLPHDAKEVDPSAPGGELDVTQHGGNGSDKVIKPPPQKTLTEPPAAVEQPTLV